MSQRGPLFRYSQEEVVLGSKPRELVKMQKKLPGAGKKGTEQPNDPGCD